MEEENSQKIIIEQLSLALEDLKSYLRDFWQFLPLPVLYTNPLFIILDLNFALADLFGFQTDELTGQSLENLLGKSPSVKKFLEELSSKRRIKDREIEVLVKGTKKVFNVSASSRQDTEGNIFGYYFSFSDITSLKASQENLEEKIKARTKELEESRIALMNMLSEAEDSRKALLNILEDAEEAKKKAEEEAQKTLAIITNFSDGILVFDREAKLSLINPPAEKFFNVENENLIGRSILELSVFPTLSSLVTLLGPEIKGLFRKELPLEENLVLEVSTAPIVKEKESLGTAVILHDITREKTIEKLKTEFVSISAHQLRTPLAAIKWTLRMLLDGDLGEISLSQRQFLERAYISNERMINLINDLLNVARIEEGRYLYNPVLVEFELVVQEAAELYKGEAEKKGIALGILAPKKKLPRIFLDIEKMKLAIQNLLDNAIRYTPAGGQVIISLKSNEDEIEFSIKDTGIGVPKDQQERIFTKFFRGANVMRMETEGTGLGLFITKNIIESHGGKIWFESEEGKGTTFYFTIPIKKKSESF